MDAIQTIAEDRDEWKAQAELSFAIRNKLEKQRDELLIALKEYLAAADNIMDPEDDDDVAAMLRFGEADKAARAIVAKITGVA